MVNEKYSKVEVEKKTLSRDELRVAIDLEYHLDKSIHGNYIELARRISSRLNIDIEARDIWLFFEPTIQEEELDLRLQDQLLKYGYE